MATPTERFNDICKAGAESAQQYTLFAMEGAERLFRLQVEAARGLYSEGTHQFLDFLWGEAAKPLAAWPRLLEKNMERNLEITRACINGTTEFQNDLAGIIREQLPAINRNLIHGVEQLSHLAVMPTRTAEAEGKRMAEPEHRTKKMAA